MIGSMSLTLLDWRRCTHEIYARVRATDDVERGWQLWREGRDALFRDHPDSPLPAERRGTFTGLPYAPYDRALRFTVAVEPGELEHFDVPTGTDGLVPVDRIGVVTLPGLGTLDVWWLGSYGGGVFLPVRDGTAGRESYGGGRYLLDTVKGADLGGIGRELVVDLNFAYHPSCAYDDAWACPLAPDGNRLDASVHAGELLP